MNDDKRLAIMANHTAELQVMLRLQIERLKYCDISLDDFIAGLLEGWQEVETRYAEALAALEPDTPCKS